MAELIWEKAVPSQKEVIFQGKRKVRPRLYTNKTNPTNLEGIFHTKTTQIISHITQFRVIKLLPWLFITHPPLTKHNQYRPAYLLQIANQTLQGSITL